MSVTARHAALPAGSVASAEQRQPERPQLSVGEPAADGGVGRHDLLGGFLVWGLKDRHPVLVRPSVGPARISCPSASSRCSRSKCRAQTAVSASVMVPAKLSRGVTK